MIVRHGAQLGTASSARPIQVVLFDAFDTLVSPRIAPHLQYAEEAVKAGLQVDEQRMASAFKQAFKTLSAEHPLYGKHTSLSGPRAWWSLLIKQTMLTSGLDPSSVNRVLPRLTTNILDRFSSREAYRLSGTSDAEVLETLKSLRAISVQSSLATNSDSAILLACRDLGLSAYINLNTDVGEDERAAATLSYDIGYEKPDARFFKEAVRRAWSTHRRDSSSSSSLTEEEKAAATLYVGDDFAQDIVGATQAGLQAAWINRGNKTVDTASQRSLPSFYQVDSLLDIVDVVRGSRHTSQQIE
ncbi:HAD-like protein [Acaromyces ingoldii]|uniref:HAD-like protein n=1 Tax=Acaromyces ingoldii TaxID=215250 RepID=A0A316YEW1_9BASI|nr:HAD-like protein [Acaromyces ingoldii]PWN88100.1 HAD-like protein [Acaromyces ingoldii]